MITENVTHAVVCIVGSGRETDNDWIFEIIVAKASVHQSSLWAIQMYTGMYNKRITGSRTIPELSVRKPSGFRNRCWIMRWIRRLNLDWYSFCRRIILVFWTAPALPTVEFYGEGRVTKEDGGDPEEHHSIKKLGCQPTLTAKCYSPEGTDEQYLLEAGPLIIPLELSCRFV